MIGAKGVVAREVQWAALSTMARAQPPPLVL